MFQGFSNSVDFIFSRSKLIFFTKSFLRLCLTRSLYISGVQCDIRSLSYKQASSLEFDPFLANVPIFYPLKNFRQPKISCRFKGYKVKSLAINGVLKFLRLFQKLADYQDFIVSKRNSYST